MTNRSASKETPPATRAELVEAIVGKVHALRGLDRELLGEQIELEHAKVEPATPTPASDAERRARELLNGFAAPASVAASPGERLNAILVERRAIGLALGVLEDRETQARAIAVAEVMQAEGKSWQAICRRRAEALMALRAANREALQFRRAVVKKAGGSPSLTLDFTGGVFANVIGDMPYRYLQEAAHRGIITGKEFEDAKR